MPGRTYQLYSGVTATTDAADFITIAVDCIVLGISISGYADLDADLELARLEVSEIPYYQGSVNDAQGVLFHAMWLANLTTSGAMRSDMNMFQPMNYALRAGQRVYHNWQLTGTALAKAVTLIHTDR